LRWLFPTLPLFVAHAFKDGDGSFGNTFGLQIFGEDFNVVIKPLKALTLDD
jgi:hypothetical protein